MKKKVIMHYDMDAFYASIEIRDKPHLKGKPVIVGTRVITTCNYEARKYGLHSAMSVAEARKLCPHGIYLNVDKDKYTKVAYQIQNLVKKISPNIEFVAFDEGYIDLTDIIDQYESYEYFALKFKERIFRHTNLTCSVGIGYNKLTAKLSSDVNKPGGHFIIRTKEDFEKFSIDKDIKIIPGIGKKTQIQLRTKGINKIDELRNYSYLELKSFLGNLKAQMIYEYCRGIDHRMIKNERKYKSIGNETTYTYKEENRDVVFATLEEIFDKIFIRLSNKKYYAKTLILKIKYEDNRTITRSKTLKSYSNKKEDFYKLFVEFKEEFVMEKSVRLAGLTFSNIVTHNSKQLSFRDIKNRKNLSGGGTVEI